jgi:general secretion pathway protein J
MSGASTLRPRAAREAGFTLVELLVSLVIIVALAGMVLAGAQLGFLTADQARKRGSGNASIITSQTVLRDRIEALVPLTRFEFLRPIADVRGEATIFSFFAPAPPAKRPASLTRYRLLRTTEGELVLFSLPDTTARINPYAPGQAGWTPQVLLTNVERLELAYFGTLPGDRQRRWRDRWIERGTPPELVRIRVSFFEGDRRTWPDLVIRPAPTVNAACTVDSDTGECSGDAA